MSDFQWVIDHAETISMNRHPVIATTVARDGTTRSVSRGVAPWSFEVKVADGIPWTTLRNLISKAEKINRLDSTTINFSNTGYDWLVKYQGGYSGNFYGNWIFNSNHLSVTSGSGGGGNMFKAGDFIQLGTSGKVYTVAADSVGGDVYLHRPVLESTGGGDLIVGKDCNWTVRCTSFPKWTLMARDQVSWDGPFTFVEEMI